MIKTLTVVIATLLVGQLLAMPQGSTCPGGCKFGGNCGAGTCDCPDFTYGGDCGRVRVEGPAPVAGPGEPVIGGCLPGKFPCQRTQCDKVPHADWGVCDCPENTGGMFCEVILIGADGIMSPAPVVPSLAPAGPVPLPEMCGLTTCSLNGVCTNTLTGFSCACNPGWSGARCSTELCTPNSCNGHGTCVQNLNEALACSCHEGWMSSRCNTQMCTELSCNPAGGVCTQHFGSTVTCACNVGWSGASCNIAPPVPASSIPVPSPPATIDQVPSPSSPVSSPPTNPVPAPPSPVPSPSTNPVPAPPASVPSPPAPVDPTCAAAGIVCQNGVCADEECICNPGWEGDLCEEPLVP